MKTAYLIALGSNQRHPRHGSPANIIRSAIAALNPDAASAIITSRPVGPSRRAYANAAVILLSALNPPQMLADLQALEGDYGRIRRGRPWGPRTLDLDIILWSGGLWTSVGLGIPHARFRTRRFVLAPACQIAPRWRDPVWGFSLRQLLVRLDRKPARA